MSKTKFTLQTVFNWLALSLLILSVYSANAMATDSSFSELVEKGEVKIAIDPFDSSEIVINQPLDIRVSVLSKLPIYEDFKLDYFDVSGAVVNVAPALSQSTIQQIEGQSWYMQQAQITIYPLQAGKFEIPQIQASIAVENQSKQILSGRVKTELQNFTITSLEELESINKFVASPKVELTTETLNKPNTDTFQVGDAVEVKYRLSADNVHVMMLPDFTSHDIEGVEVYAQPAKDENVQNRLSKSNTAVRTQTITYVFSEGGEFELPVQTIKWWNTKTKSLEVLSTTKTVFNVDGESLPRVAPIFESLSSIAIGYWEYLVAVFILFVFVTRSFIRFWPHTKEYYQQKRLFRASSLITLIDTQFKENDFVGIVDSIYQIAKVRGISSRHLDEQMSDEHKETWKTLLMCAFDNHKPQRISANEIKALANALKPSKPHKYRHSKFVFNWGLNPDNK